MKKHYVCKSNLKAIDEVLDFYWDEKTGEVSGPGADYIMEAVNAGGTTCYPLWNWHKLGPAPLKSKSDMAAIIGFGYIVPEDLKPFYPKYQFDMSKMPEDIIF